MSACPFCHTSIAANATLCTHCGRSLGPVALKVATLLKDGAYRVTQVLRRQPTALFYRAIRNTDEAEQVIWEFAPVFAERKSGQGGLRGTYRHLAAIQANLTRFMQFRHPSLWLPAELLQENNTLYAVFDPPQGLPLEDVIRQQGPLSADRVLYLGQQAAQALDLLHTRQSLHLGLSPLDLYLNEQDQLTLGMPDPAWNLPFERPATGMFAAPEQPGTAATLSPATDLFSLSATLWYALTNQMATYPLPTDTDSPPLVQALIASLNPAASERPQTVQQWLALLGAPAALSSLPPDPRSQSRRILWVAAAAVLGLGLGGYLGLRGMGQPPVSLAEVPQKTITLPQPNSTEPPPPAVPSPPEATAEPATPAFPSDPPEVPAPIPVPTSPAPASSVPAPAAVSATPVPAQQPVSASPAPTAAVADNPPQTTRSGAPTPSKPVAISANRPTPPVATASTPPQGTPTTLSPNPTPIPRVEPLNTSGRTAPAAQSPSVELLVSSQPNLNNTPRALPARSTAPNTNPGSPAVEVLPPN